MSVSSVASGVSVGFRGQAVDLEVALDTTIRSLQQHLNLIQCHLRSIAAMADQDCEFKLEVEESDKVDDECREMGWLFSDLRAMAEDLVSKPNTPEDKIWYKAHKAQRKLDDKRIEAEHAVKVKEERAANKTALKLAMSAISESKMEE